MHLIVDATYELPVAYELAKASVAEQPAGHTVFKNLVDNHPGLVYESGGPILIRAAYDG
ncbi:MAG: hypothetical protein KJ970_03370 [Candidatus Eisenbacteria bacterium]|uniref:Uncharacterized protein n=1 Tax=Eiseniibacteriota bacterium TaxID=2212470 RepID=A0A948RTZ5_UNCEI|nr:hypothetical protein [Candidatus Eisenbacteria bacterium]MBU1949508.1 hypothetical protein [Candidatus Eisenbacteria bacterium]MBU2689941.1 hypothetical protein [Candidatus Eisenbacteria bacterium]